MLVFVQFPDLMKKVTEAFTSHKVKFLEIRGTASQKSKNLEQFQNNSEERVLLLNVMDESASGANLTSANHAIFLSPLLAPSKEIDQARVCVEVHNVEYDRRGDLRTAQRRDGDRHVDLMP